MKCNRCYVSIPAGQEIQKGIWGQETVCPKCAVIRDNQRVWFWVILIGIWVLFIIIPLLFLWWTTRRPLKVS